MDEGRERLVGVFAPANVATRDRLGLMSASRTTHRLTAGVVAAVALLLAASFPGLARAGSHDFPKPAVLRPAVDFWKKIFASYSEHQVVVHDAWYLGKVYEVLDFRYLAPDGETIPAEYEGQKRAEVNEAKERVQQILLHLADAGPNPTGLSAEEQKIFDMFRDVPDPDKFGAAAERVRSQSGLREKFVAGVAREQRYLARMERIFRDAGMPTELARLPLVESCFNVDAYSKVGAAGVWQFMPATGRQYLRINAAVDERRDPLRSTHAAAEHLHRDYDSLGRWPLAITAYNHGREGVARGVDSVGSDDIGEIAMRYHGPAFGFASRNFYAEFLAVLEVVQQRSELLGDLRLAAQPAAREIELQRSMGLYEAARMAGVSRDTLLDANPALLDNVARGRMPIPRGVVLYVPSSGRSAEPEVEVARADDAPQPESSVATASDDQTASAVEPPPPPAPEGKASDRGRSAARPSSSKSRFKGGATFASAKSKHGKAKDAKVQVASAASSKKKAPATVTHEVRPGQTLIDIARRYGTTVALIQGMNNLRHPKGLQAGQKLRIPQT